MTKFTDDEGREFEFRGKYRVPGRIHNSYYLSAYGGIVHSSAHMPSEVRAIVHPVTKPPTYYDFGRVRFEGEDKPRVPEKDEWFLGKHTQTILYSEQGLVTSPQVILKPVAILELEDLGTPL